MEKKKAKEIRKINFWQNKFTNLSFLAAFVTSAPAIRNRPARR
jgi:hypothetical protein